MDKNVPHDLDKAASFTETALVLLDAVQAMVVHPARAVILIVTPGRPDCGMMIGEPGTDEVRGLLDHIDAQAGNDIGPSVMSEVERRKFRRNRRG